MIAREGIKYILFFVIVTLLLSIVSIWIPLLLIRIILWIWIALFLLVVYFLRDPQRRIPPAEDSLLAPADGRVIAIQEIDDPFVGPAVKISIFLSLLDVHVNRSIADGTVRGQEYRKGRFHAAFSEKSAEENESNRLECQQEERRFVIVQIAGMIARRIISRAAVGQQLQRGERFGMILFGSRVEVILPCRVQLQVSLRQKVRAGETIIGKWHASV